MSRYIDADELIEFFDGYPDHIEFDVEDIKSIINEQDAADVVEVGKWCDMHEYILEMQADENGHNEFFRIIKLPVIFSDDEADRRCES